MMQAMPDWLLSPHWGEGWDWGRGLPCVWQLLAGARRTLSAWAKPSGTWWEGWQAREVPVPAPVDSVWILSHSLSPNQWFHTRANESKGTGKEGEGGGNRWRAVAYRSLLLLCSLRRLIQLLLQGRLKRLHFLPVCVCVCVFVCVCVGLEGKIPTVRPCKQAARALTCSVLQREAEDSVWGSSHSVGALWLCRRGMRSFRQRERKRGREKWMTEDQEK